MRTSKARNFFSPQEREMIHEAIRGAELTTSGEIAAMVVDSSADYPEGEITGAVVVGVLIAVIPIVFTGYDTIWYYIPTFSIVALLARLPFRHFPALMLPFLSRERLENAVRGRAICAFFQKQLYKTKHETGILIFLSLFERKVWILGDRGINSKVSPESWQEMARELAVGVKENRACEALCRVITQCGEKLREHFPRQVNDIQELPDEVITE